MSEITRYNSRLKEPSLPRSSLIIWFLAALLGAFVVWVKMRQRNIVQQDLPLLRLM